MNLTDLLKLEFARRAFDSGTGRGPGCIPPSALAAAPARGLTPAQARHAEGCKACARSIVLSVAARCDSAEPFSAYALGNTPIAAAIEAHAATCPTCRDSLAHLPLLSKLGMSWPALRKPAPKVSPMNWILAGLQRAVEHLTALLQTRPVFALSCACAAALLVAVSFFHAPISRTVAGWIKPPAGVKPPSASVINDGVLEADLFQPGNVTLTGEAIPAEWRDQVLRMIGSRPVLQPEPVKSAVDKTRSATLERGVGNQPGQEPVLLSPVATAVATTRPSFHWTGVANDRGYTLYVADEHDREILTRPTGSKTEFSFSPDSLGLAPGHTYYWQIGTTVAGELRIADRESFLIPDASTLSTVAALQKQFANSPMLLAAVDESYGLYDDAAEQLRILKTLNPSSDLPDRLLADLAERRQKK